MVDKFEWLMFWKRFGKKNPKVKVKAKKIKVTVRDLQENCVRIKAAMDREKVGTPAYEALQQELKKEYETIQKMKEANQVISVKDALVVGGTAISLVFFIALTREYPTALKIASMIMKWIPYKGI